MTMDKNRRKDDQARDNEFEPVGELRPIDQPVEALTVMTDKDGVRVVAGDAGATSAEVINEKNNGDRKKQK